MEDKNTMEMAMEKKEIITADPLTFFEAGNGVLMEIRRVSDPDKAQIIWDGIKTVRAQKQVPALPRLSRYMNRNYKLDKDTTQRLLDLAVEDNLVRLHKKVGTKGNKAGVEEDAYRLPTEDMLPFERHDWYCFHCHVGGEVALCRDCHRVYHPTCLKEELEEAMPFVCQFCRAFHALPRTHDKDERRDLNNLLYTVTLRLKERLPVNILSRAPPPPAKNPYLTSDRKATIGENGIVNSADREAFASFGEEKWRAKFLLKRNLDLEEVMAKCQSQQYRVLLEYKADIQNIVHNVVIYHGNHSTMADQAKMMFRQCQADLQEIETCRDCFRYGSGRGDKYWFAKPCRPFHEIVYAKQKGYPYWPAKVVKIKTEVDNAIEVRFFGGFHQKATIERDNVKPITTNVHSLQIKKNSAWNKASEELSRYQDLYEKCKNNPDFLSSMYGDPFDGEKVTQLTADKFGLEAESDSEEMNGPNGVTAVGVTVDEGGPGEPGTSLGPLAPLPAAAPPSLVASPVAAVSLSTTANGGGILTGGSNSSNATSNGQVSAINNSLTTTLMAATSQYHIPTQAPAAILAPLTVMPQSTPPAATPPRSTSRPPTKLRRIEPKPEPMSTTVQTPNGQQLAHQGSGAATISTSIAAAVTSQQQVVATAHQQHQVVQQQATGVQQQQQQTMMLPLTVVTVPQVQHQQLQQLQPHQLQQLQPQLSLSQLSLPSPHHIAPHITIDPQQLQEHYNQLQSQPQLQPGLDQLYTTHADTQQLQEALQQLNDSTVTSTPHSEIHQLHIHNTSAAASILQQQQVQQMPPPQQPQVQPQPQQQTQQQQQLPQQQVSHSPQAQTQQQQLQQRLRRQQLQQQLQQQQQQQLQQQIQQQQRGQRMQQQLQQQLIDKAAMKQHQEQSTSTASPTALSEPQAQQQQTQTTPLQPVQQQQDQKTGGETTTVLDPPLTQVKEEIREEGDGDDAVSSSSHVTRFRNASVQTPNKLLRMVAEEICGQNNKKPSDRDFKEFADKLRAEFVQEKCRAINVATRSLEKDIERMKADHATELENIQEKERAKLSEIKKKQWCYNCESEAIYWCCWNTAYCSTDCQQQHWHREHKRMCRRKR